jgi:hypothetical protein
MDSPELETAARRAAEEAWRSLGGDPRRLAQLQLEGRVRALPSVYDVSAFANACVGVSTLAIAEWIERAGGAPQPARVDSRHVAVAFTGERWLEPIGWALPAVWDALAGDYPAADGFVRLHTNYAHHRAAALRALEVPGEREAVATALARRSAEDVEAAVVAQGGCAAAMRTESAWAEHPAGRAVAAEPLIDFASRGDTGDVRRAQPQAQRPLAALRVVDLTRVIAGPIATRQLAAYGADVVRIDLPGFEEVPALLPETTAGKRCAALDLRSADDRRRFELLLAQADVLVCGLRSDALERLEYDRARLSNLNPGLIVARLDAYGWSGPWKGRRGFDSLVQMSAGIADRGMQATGANEPVPLPAQALDHGTGYLLAAAIVRALCERAERGHASDVRLSLARTARFLISLGASERMIGQQLTAADRACYLDEVGTAWGRIRRVRCPGSVGSITPELRRQAGPLGIAQAEWLA